MNVEAIEQAIVEFYRTADGRQKTHTWLSAIQCSPEAWQFSWTLISENKSQEVQFFGATTLQNKILKYWFEVPEQSVTHLRSQLLEKILIFGGEPGGKLIANKLCLAMSAFILHTVTTDWPDAVKELISSFQSMDRLPDEVRCRLLLEVLTGLAEQYPQANLGFKTGKRAAVHAKLVEDFEHIYQLLSSLLEPTIPTSMKESALRCLTSWVDFGIRIDKLDLLVSKSFVCLYDNNLFETAVDTLIAALTKNEPYKYPNTMQKYFLEIFKLSSLWQTAIAEENMEWCRDISRLVINFGEENAGLLLRYITGTEEQQKLSMGIVNMILALTDVKGCFPVDETLSDLSFGFWAILQDLVLAGTEEYFNHYMAIFTPVYIALVHILLRKIQYPDDVTYNSMSAEEKEQFRCYRQDVIDTVTYANCLLRDNLLMLLKSYIASVTQALPNVRWQEVEGLLYILSNVTEDSLSADEEEWDLSNGGDLLKAPNNLLDDILEDLINLLKKLNLENKVLLEAVLQAIGAFSEHYSHKPELLSIVFPVILLHGLSHPDTAIFATRALKDICKDNMTHITTYSEGILNVCHHKLLEGSMAPRNAARLLSCVGHVLSSLSYDKIVEWLKKFLPPITESLNSCASASPSMKVKMQIMDKLQMMTWLFDSLDVKKTEVQMATSPHVQPVLIIMKDLLPIIQSILSNWVADSDIIECIVELIKNSLHTLVDDFIEILQDVCVLVVKIYECQQHHSILEIIKQVVLMFAKDNITYELVKDTFHSIAHKTTLVLAQDPHSKTDLVESYMLLCSQMSKKSSNLLVDDNFPFQQTLETCVVGISFPEAPTMKACCLFLSDILTKKDKYKQLDQLVPAIAPQLYDILLKSIGGAAPRTNIEHTTGIFLAMNVGYLEVANSAMTVLLNQENYPAPQPTPVQKSRFIKDVLRERGNKRRLKETIVSFSMVCRGIAGTEYALSTAESLQFR